MSKVAVIAVGGNSLIKDKSHQGVPDQYRAAAETCEHILEMIELGYEVVITHGNGPQVGFILRRCELAYPEVHMVPLDFIGADTQGSIGYTIQRALYNRFIEKGIKKPISTVVTQVVVDKNDPSFQNPTKPIGSFMNEEEALAHKEKDGWDVVEDAGRGWRRVVASPIPKEIVELEAIKNLVKAGVVTISVGGGGIPVCKDEQGKLKGAAAVIDKDFASSLLARNINADLFVISTAVEKVYLNFGKENQQALDNVKVAELKKYIEEGHFAPGSMLPKIKAIIEFLENAGKDSKAIITNPENLKLALEGKTGTHITL